VARECGEAAITDPTPAAALGTLAPSASRRVQTKQSQWLGDAIKDDRGNIVSNLANAAIALRTAPQLTEAFCYDELQRHVIVKSPLPRPSGAEPRGASLPRPLSSEDVSQLQEWLQYLGLPKIGRETVLQAIELRAHERAFHPVRDYLEGLKWDRQERIEKWLSTYLGAEPTPYTLAIGRMFPTAAVARIYEPGCTADYVIVLEGAQGSGKSRAVAALGGLWFSDSLPDVTRDKEAAQHLRGKWIIEISELSALRRAEADALKSFISRPVERYRPPYGRIEVIEPRQCIFIGTTNRATYLSDDTGGRRFWPVKVGKIDVDALAKDRDQLFAEAVAAYRNGEQWWPAPDLERRYIQPEQEARFEADAWEPLIAAYVEDRERVQLSQVAFEALNIDAAKIGTIEQRRITAVLTRLKRDLLRPKHILRW
jgi:predicted P-loop ATPase